MMGELLAQVSRKEMAQKMITAAFCFICKLIDGICLIFFFLSLQKADLAIADLTITYEREQAVDFTMPFMNLGQETF